MRDEKGRIIAGSTLSPEFKEKISEGQRARHARVRAELPPLVKWRKKCSQCGELKLVDLEDRKASEFPVRKRKIATGDTLYPAGECKACNAKRAADYREKLRAEGKLAEKQAEWNNNRDPEHRKAYQRGYQARQRRREGVPARGPWKKYRGPQRIEVPAEPFRQWLLDRELPPLDHNDRDRLKRVLEGADTVDLIWADRIMTAAGEGWMSTELWPNA